MPASLIRVLFVLTLVIGVAEADAPPLGADEVALARWIDEHAGEAESLLARLADINSGTMNVEGVRAVGDVLAAEYRQIGLQPEWVELPPAMQRAGHLVVAQEGTKGRKLLLIGHLDTVFEPDDAFQETMLDGRWLHGPGVEDMKGGDVVMLYALKALNAIGALEDRRFVAYLTGDEESPGSPLGATRDDLVEKGRWADVALGFEAGIADESAEYATVARRGATEWMLEVEGLQAHSSGIFGKDVGSGAIFEAARILTAFHEEVRGEQYLTFNPGAILGGTAVEYDAEHTSGTVFGKTNVVASHVVVHGGIRTISPDQLERARRAMEAVVADSLPHTSATIRFTEGYPPMAPTDGNLSLQSMLSDINESLGGQPMPALDPSRRGAADISFVAPYTDSLAGLGPVGEGGHSPSERIDLDSMAPAIKRAAILIYRLTRD